MESLSTVHSFIPQVMLKGYLRSVNGVKSATTKLPMQNEANCTSNVRIVIKSVEISVQCGYTFAAMPEKALWSIIL